MGLWMGPSLKRSRTLTFCSSATDAKQDGYFLAVVPRVESRPGFWAPSDDGCLLCGPDVRLPYHT